MQETKKRGWLLTVIAIVIAIFTGFLFFSYLNSLERAIGDRVSVIVATQHIPARTLITPDLLTEAEIPRRFVHDSYFFTVSDLVIGYVAIANIEEGQILQRNMLDANAGLDPGYRAVSLSADLVGSVGGNVRPGNRVDVVVSYENQDQNHTIIMLEDVKVLAVNTLLPSGGSDMPAAISANRFLPSGEMIKDSVVTLALRPEEAARLTYMSNFGNEVRLMIRRLDEPGSIPVGPITESDFQSEPIEP